MRIFVSYTTRDGYLNVERLKDIDEAIKQFGIVYIDILHNNSADRQRRVEYELALSSIVVFLITPAVHESFWFMKEKRIAEHHKKRCIEICLDNSAEWDDTLNLIKQTLINDSQPPKHSPKLAWISQ
jgi:hypothetical protein